MLQSTFPTINFVSSEFLATSEMFQCIKSKQRRNSRTKCRCAAQGVSRVPARGRRRIYRDAAGTFGRVLVPPHICATSAKRLFLRRRLKIASGVGKKLECARLFGRHQPSGRTLDGTSNDILERDDITIWQANAQCHMNFFCVFNPI